MTDASEYNEMNRRVIAEFRENGGKVGGMFAGAPLLLLHTVGAKSGQARIFPLVYTEDGDRLVVIASKGGAPTNPDWYHNLVAAPDATIELGEETFRVRAAVAEGAERDRLYDQMAEQQPQFAEYQRMTERRIPLFVLKRVADGD